MEPEFEAQTLALGEQGDVLDLSDLFGEKPASTEIISLEDKTEEVAPKTAVEEKQEETPKEVVKEPSYFKKLVQKKIDAGEWYPPSDFEELEVTEDVFESIVQAQIEYAEQTAKIDTVKIDGLSPMMVKALEIDKNGGSISQVFETYKNIYENPENPISGLDLNNATDQERLLRFYHKGRNLEDFEIQSIVEGHKKNLTLDKAALKAQAEIDSVFDNYLNETAQKAEELNNQKTEALKLYRSNVSEELKKYQINDTFRKKLTDNISKPDEKGTYFLDAVYDQWRRDPEKAVKIAMFMDNEEEYIKQRAGKIITNEKQKIFLEIKNTNKGKGSGTVDYNTSNANKKDDINLTEL